MKKDLEERLNRLEETAWFQDEHLKELDSQLLAQQQQLAAFERELGRLRLQILRLRELASATASLAETSSQEPLPPHYQSTAWHSDS